MRRAALLLLVAIGGCEIEKIAIPRTEARVAMHGVLSATAETQVVLLERTRTGSVELIAPPFDLGDPVVSDEGIAEMGATMSLTTPDGTTLLAREDNTVRGDGKGGGIYRFTLPGDALVRNGTYRLSVRTTKGEVLTAETTVPEGTPATGAEQRVFNRDEETLDVVWPAVAGARSYFVRVETPYGPRSFFTDSTRIRLPGALRNVNVEELPHVFIPGFPQAVTVSAVDSNYYDWYRTHNDEVTGTGIINRVTGGLGVFGSLVRLRFQNLTVVVPQTEPVTGTYRVVGSFEEVFGMPVLGFELYLESRAARAGQADALSGRYEKRLIIGESDPIRGLLGNVRGSRIELSLLRRWSGRDTTDVFTGEIRGDTIVGSYRLFGGPVRFVKQR